MNYARLYPRFWLAYFVLLVCVSAYNAIFELVRATIGESSITGLLGVLFGAVALLPIYGYARQRVATPRWLSIAILVVSSMAIAGAALIVVPVAAQHGFAAPVIAAIVTIASALPYLFGVYQYCFRSPHIWRHAT
jgi:hypothetical protein